MKNRSRPIFLAVLAVTLLSNWTLVAGDRQLASCQSAADGPNILNLDNFPIQPSIFQQVTDIDTSSVANYYQMLLGAESNYYVGLQSAYSFYGANQQPMPANNLSPFTANTGYVVVNPWTSLVNTPFGLQVASPAMTNIVMGPQTISTVANTTPQIPQVVVTPQVAAQQMALANPPQTITYQRVAGTPQPISIVPVAVQQQQSPGFAVNTPSFQIARPAGH